MGTLARDRRALRSFVMVMAVGPGLGCRPHCRRSDLDPQDVDEGLDATDDGLETGVAEFEDDVRTAELTESAKIDFDAAQSDLASVEYGQQAQHFRGA